MLRRCETCPSDIDEELLAQLKDWRLRTSKEMSVPAYVVFTDNTLIAIAETLPTDDAALVAIPGIGARKLEQFGPDVLERLVQGPPIVVKIVPKPQVRKSLVGFGLLSLNLKITHWAPTYERRVLRSW